ncbi:hypothetical protein BegalDRAFT_0914 [Beggiatoa alba B18LD]|uniref:Membrane protein implicated in regulation of membrane protease activity n=1 Tax=Beggiatoa alba B18LD TaxID=395493 RepID=I3CDX9_9GAMM|nr:hypothetical protein [Beggiatoa alba]EIJ41822.1 hypothetical protein BegalDRAFT_0914 [Beggiatoa alba B18LD]
MENNFLNIILTFPNVIFTILLGIILLYWILVILGALDIEFFDIDDLDNFFESIHTGFAHAPFTIIFSLFTLCAWILSALGTQLLLTTIYNEFWQFLFGVLLLVLSIWLSAYITVYLIVPLQKWLPQTEGAKIRGGQDLLGKVCKITTGQVSANAGQAEYNDGGAGLVLTVRTHKATVHLKKGDNALIVEYDAKHNIYYVDSFE